MFGDCPERFLTLEHTEPGVLLPFRFEGLGEDAAVAELSWGPRWGALWRDITLDFFTGFHYLADATYPTDDRLVLDWSLDGVTKSEDVIITQDAERSDVFALVKLLADGQKPRVLNVPAGEEAHTTPDTVETGREVPAGALGALAAVGAGLVLLARGRVRRVRRTRPTSGPRGGGRETVGRPGVCAQPAGADSMGPVQPQAEESTLQSSATLRVMVRQMSAVTGAESRLMVPGMSTHSPPASRYSPM